METCEIDCRFCGAKGVDPYGILAWGSTCYVCHGRKVVRVPSPHRACRFCRGSGSYKTFSCPVCLGAGVLPVPTEPVERCWACAGRAYEHSSGLPCLECKGRGMIAVALQHEERTS